MTFGAPESETSDSPRIPSIVVLGADALLAARPATPIQLAHACLQVGYQNVVPASWGDELIAAASLRALRQHGQLPAIQCSCPHVARRLLATGTDLQAFLLSLVAPPIALARYLREMHAPGQLHITYVGGCPGATDESIDERITPDALLATFNDRHIAIEQQPDYFDSIIPPDRRRYRSQPGGLPTAEMLWSANGNGSVATRSLVEIFGDELPVELAQHLLAGKPALIDVAPTLGCVCSGADETLEPLRARARVTDLEPPRATHPILDETVLDDTSVSLPIAPPSAIDPAPTSTEPVDMTPPERVAPNEPVFVDGESAPRPHLPRHETETALSLPQSHGGRRYSPARGVARLNGLGLPTARDADGRQLPRTYVARRRAPTRNRTASPLDPQATPIPEPLSPISSSSGEALPAIEMPPLVGSEPVASRRAPAERRMEEERDSNGKFAERAVSLPVTRLSDGRRREETSPKQPGDRPVIQILTVGLLISMIVLVSVTVGVLVGRWLTQR